MVGSPGSRVAAKSAPPELQPLEGQFTVHRGHHDRTGFDLPGTVDHQQITVADTGADHRIALDTQEEGRRRVPNHVLVEIDGTFEVIIGGRRNAGGNARPVEGQGQRGRMSREGLRGAGDGTLRPGGQPSPHRGHQADRQADRGRRLAEGARAALAPGPRTGTTAAG